MGAKAGFTCTAGKLDPVALLDTALFGIVRMDLEHVLVVPDDVVGASCLCTHIVLAQNAAGRQQERETRPGFFVGCNVVGADEPALAANESVDMHDRRAVRRIAVAGPLNRAFFIKQFIGDIGETRCGDSNLVHDLARMGVIPVCTHRVGQELGHLPVGIAVFRGHDLADTVDAPLCVGEGSVLLQECGTRKEDMGVVCSLVQEEIVNDDAIHGGKACGDMLCVRVRLENVLALDVDAPEGAIHGGVQHVRDPQAGLIRNGHAPSLFEDIANLRYLHMAVAGKFVREGAHVTGTLHVVLAAQRVHADAIAADIAGQHGKVGNADDGGRTLAVLGDAQAVIDCAVSAGCVEPGCGAQFAGRNAGQCFGCLRAVGRIGDEFHVVLEGVHFAAFANERHVVKPLGNDHMGERGDHGNVGAGFQCKVLGSANMRRLHQIDAARVDDDQFRALAQALLQPRCENRVAVGRVCPDDDDDVSLFDGVEVLGSRRSAKCLPEAVSSGGMAYAGAGVGVVVAEDRAGKLLHEERLLVGAAGGGDDANGILAGFVLDGPQPVCREIERLVPGDFAPGLVDGLADHRVEDPVLVAGIAPGKASLDTGMAAVGLAILVGDHAHEFLTAHFRLEGAANAAIGAGGDDGMLRLADFDERFFRQRGGGAGLNAGAAGYAFGGQKGLVHACRNPALEAASLDGQGEGSLNFLTCPYATRTDDALRRIIGEVGVGFVLGHPAHVDAAGIVARRDMVIAFVAVAYITQANGACHVLQFAVAIGGAGQAVERVVGDVEFHHAAAQLLELLGLGANYHAVFGRRGAGGGGSAASLDLDQAEAAGSKGIDHVGCAQFGDLNSRFRCGAHQRSSPGHRNIDAINRERHLLL